MKPAHRRRYGYIDKSGDTVVEPVFFHASDFKGGLGAVIVGKECEDFRYGYVDRSGNYVWEPSR